MRHVKRRGGGGKRNLYFIVIESIILKWILK